MKRIWKELVPSAFALLVVISLMPSSIRADPAEMSRDDIICLAQSGVGFSYWWGGGRWCNSGCSPDFSCPAGSCSGSCPSCTHTGDYGADCSGFAAKVWQVPNPIDLSTAGHPYSTESFRCSEIHWYQIDKNDIEMADALVYRNGGCPGSSGHIMIYESGDPWGSAWTYEARGCSIGIVHNSRSVSSEYIAIRRVNLVASCIPAEEVCDGEDNDCDGSVDEDYVPFTCGVGECEVASTCTDGVEECSPPAGEPEICDGRDNDCDGETDEDNVCLPDEEPLPELLEEDGGTDPLVEDAADDITTVDTAVDTALPDSAPSRYEIRGIEGGCSCAIVSKSK